jgi:hypothetical protein
MKAYFDNESSVNLGHIPQIKSVRTQEELFRKILPLTSIVSTDYSEPGLWPVEVSTHTHLWANQQDSIPGSINIFDHIPTHVITGVQERKLRIFIIAIIEGTSFVNDIADSFSSLTRSIHDHNLPRYSVIIVSGDLNAKMHYVDWCKDNNEIPWIEFIDDGVEWDGSQWELPTAPVFNKDAPYLFNSLNRAHRPHRTDHLYMLVYHNILSMGLVSGGSYFPQERYTLFPTYVNCHYVSYRRMLFENYPKQLDVNNLHASSLGNAINLDNFSNSLLTISTESHFKDTGLFITEKSLRPLAVGHPVMILGQPSLMAKLQEWGFLVDFLNIEYDDILDPVERFSRFHQILVEWIYSDKKQYFDRWQEMVIYNQKIYQSLNFKQQYINLATLSTEQYFKS